MGEKSLDGLAPEAELNESVSDIERGTYTPASSNKSQDAHVSIDHTGAAIQHVSHVPTDNVEPYNDNGPHPWSDDDEQLNMTDKQAFEYLNRVSREPYIDPNHDTTIQDVLENQIDWVKSLMRAILNLNQVFDKPGSSPLTKVKKTSKHKVEAVSRRIFHTVIDRCLHGYRGDPKQDKAIPSTTPNTENPPDTELTCQERMNAVVGTLQTYKCVCISVIDGGNFDAIANHPLALRLTKVNERKNNDARAETQLQTKSYVKIPNKYGLVKKDANGKILPADEDTYCKLLKVKLQDKTANTSNHLAKGSGAANTVSPPIDLSIASNRYVPEMGRVQGSMLYDIAHASQPSVVAHHHTRKPESSPWASAASYSTPMTRPPLKAPNPARVNTRGSQSTPVNLADGSLQSSACASDMNTSENALPSKYYHTKTGHHYHNSFGEGPHLYDQSRNYRSPYQNPFYQHSRAVDNTVSGPEEFVPMQQQSSYHGPSRDPNSNMQGHMTAKQFKEPKYWHSEAQSQGTQCSGAQFLPVAAARPGTLQRKRERFSNQDPNATEHVSPPNFKKARTMENTSSQD